MFRAISLRREYPVKTVRLPTGFLRDDLPLTLDVLSGVYKIQSGENGTSFFLARFEESGPEMTTPIQLVAYDLKFEGDAKATLNYYSARVREGRFIDMPPHWRIYDRPLPIEELGFGSFSFIEMLLGLDE